jgi:hypothetical protein
MITTMLRFSVLATVLAYALPAYAQFTETWVSHNGNDANQCNTATTPCQTFAGAISMTLAGGQINVLDAGDFGSALIQQSVSIVNAVSGTATIIPPSFSKSPEEDRPDKLTSSQGPMASSPCVV